jgi:hypothetical protein
MKGSEGRKSKSDTEPVKRYIIEQIKNRGIKYLSEILKEAKEMYEESLKCSKN